jgi:hypothetical protein
MSDSKEREEGFRFGPYAVGDEGAICRLFEHIYGRALPVESWRWRFLDGPDGPGIQELAWHGPRLVSHFAVSRVAAFVQGAAVGSGLTGTIMTDSEFRGRRLFQKLAAQVYETFAGSDGGFVWGFPNAVSHRGFVRDLEWRDIHEIPVLRLDLAGIKPTPACAHEVVQVPGFSTHFDKLWQEVKRGYTVIACRDRRHLEWRYARKPGERYRVLGYFDHEELRGYAVFKRYEDELQVVDILTVPDEDVGVALISSAVELAQQEAACAIGMWLNVAHPLHRALEKLGFRLEGPVTYFGGRVLRPGLPERELYDYRCWYLTMGDSDVY